MAPNQDAKTKKAVNTKSYQILAHMTYSDHDFFEAKDGKLLIKPVATFCRMMNMVPREMVRRLTYLERKGFIIGFEAQRGEILVELKRPKNWFEIPASVLLADTSVEVCPDDEPTISELLDRVAGIPGVHELRKQLIPEPTTEKTKTFNPTTLKFE